MPRKLLSDILRDGQRQTLVNAWDSTAAAQDLAPLPAGDYTAAIESGELFTAKRGTAGYKLTFRICEGEYTGRKCWLDTWLTQAALSLAKRDLGKIGISCLGQLERPLPSGIVCAVKLVLRRDDDGTEFNKVKSFTVLRVDAPASDPFAPSTNGDGEHQADAEHDAATAQRSVPATLAEGEGGDAP